MSPEELEAFLERAFPGSSELYGVTGVDPGGIDMVLKVTDRHGRPGGTLSGPAMMTFADSAAWLAILSQIGPVALAVTTSLHIDFLRKPALEHCVGRAAVLKLGRQLAVVEVGIASISTPEALVAKAQVTYSIPPER